MTSSSRAWCFIIVAVFQLATCGMVWHAIHDWAAGRDPQLDTAVRLALQALEQRTPAAPPTV